MISTKTIRTVTMFFLFAFINHNATAQVTIGSLEAPGEGALLDLKEENITTKGLGLGLH